MRDNPATIRINVLLDIESPLRESLNMTHESLRIKYADSPTLLYDIIVYTSQVIAAMRQVG